MSVRFKVGDRVRITKTHDSEFVTGDTGTVIQVEVPWYDGDYSHRVRLDRNNDKCWPLDEYTEPLNDTVSHPSHYTNHPSGVECIDIVQHMNFPLGNVIKYVWRADSKGSALEDLEKAAEYLRIEIERRKAAAK